MSKKRKIDCLINLFRCKFQKDILEITYPHFTSLISSAILATARDKKRHAYDNMKKHDIVNTGHWFVISK